MDPLEKERPRLLKLQPPLAGEATVCTSSSGMNTNYSKVRKSTVAEVTTNYPKVFVQLPLQLKAHLNCKVSSHLFSPKSPGTILSLEPNKVWHMSWRKSWRKSVQCIFTRLLEFKVESFTLNQSTLQSQSCKGEMFYTSQCRRAKSRGD